MNRISMNSQRARLAHGKEDERQRLKAGVTANHKTEANSSAESRISPVAGNGPLNAPGLSDDGLSPRPRRATLPVRCRPPERYVAHRGSTCPPGRQSAPEVTLAIAAVSSAIPSMIPTVCAVAPRPSVR
jgi:hypothetical protein